MRILAVVSAHPNPVDPYVNPANGEVLRALAGQHDVTALVPLAWTDEVRARLRGARLPRGRREERGGVELAYPRYLFPPKVLLGWHGHCLRASLRPAFDRAVARARPDVVYVPWAYPDGWAGVELGHRAGLPVVIHVRGSDVRLAGRSPARARRTAEALRRADAVAAVSRDLAERVVAFGADPRWVRVIYRGVNPGVFHPGPRPEARRRLGLDGDGPLVLFVGDLIPLKGPDLLLDACARLAGQGLPFRCCLIGQGPLRPRLEQQTARLGLGDRVRLVGPVPHERLPDWYRAADVVTLPSHSEGVPMVLLEAAACGAPFVASDVGGIPEIAGHGVSRLVPPGDATALAEALAPFVSGPPGRLDNPSPVRRTPADMVQELLGLFEEAVARHNPAGPSRREPDRREAVS